MFLYFGHLFWFPFGSIMIEVLALCPGLNHLVFSLNALWWVWRIVVGFLHFCLLNFSWVVLQHRLGTRFVFSFFEFFMFLNLLRKEMIHKCLKHWLKV